MKKTVLYIVLYFGVVATLYGAPVPTRDGSAKVKEIKIEKVGDEVSQGVKVFVSTDASEYKDFMLQDSERVVIDFMNTVSHLPSQITSMYSPLARIRTSQYQIKPIPITRIVLDLMCKTPYSVSHIDKGVEITLGNKSEKANAIRVEPVKMEKDIESDNRTPITDNRTIVQDTIKQDTTMLDTTKKVLVSAPEPFFYNPRGRNDPFKPYLGTPSKDSLLDVSTATIVGIMWSPQERYALAEDASGKGFILMEGDPVSSGKVTKIDKKEVFFWLKVFGGTRQVTLKITSKGEKKENE
ncbi:MAG: AMIN domain-containing protein [Candidatus Stahlbacteria bacterium]|nr:AMIN domain-containing protein [Candidatus Stahlbacteria bacterium]